MSITLSFLDSSVAVAFNKTPMGNWKTFLKMQVSFQLRHLNHAPEQNRPTRTSYEKNSMRKEGAADWQLLPDR